MNIQEFESLEQRMRDANCVEDVFGETEPDAITLGEIKSEVHKFRDKIRYDKKLFKKVDSLVERQFVFFFKWAFRQKHLRRYGSRDKAPLTVHLEVTLKDNELMFRTKGQKSIVYLSEIHAAYFSAYWHSDKVTVQKDGKLLFKGNVIYYGTHAAQEYFHGVTADNDRTRLLEASMYEAGTTIEIQTWAFFNLRDFISKEFK